MFIKKQEARGWLSNLGLKIPLSTIPLLGDTLFKERVLIKQEDE